MADRSSVRGSGLDVVLPGVTVAGIGASAGIVSDSAGATPSFVRVFRAPEGTTYPAALSQDEALPE